MTISTDIPDSPFYQQLVDRVDNQILHLQDVRGEFLIDKLNELNLKYFVNRVLDKPWNNHLLFGILVHADRNIDVATIHNVAKDNNARLKNLFDFFQLKRIVEFDVEVHMYQYLKGAIFKEHSNNTRREFLRGYRALSYSTRKWLTSKLNKEQQLYFQQYLFPMPSFDSRDFSFTKLAIEERTNTRKSETDAVVPLLPQIRAEGHFRWNQMQRLRQAFIKACEQIKKTNEGLPLEFQYDEPERIGERFYFRLWDKSSFIMYHQNQFPSSVVTSAKKRSGTYSDENNHYFVEFIKAERKEDNEFAEGFWFTQLFKEGVVGQWSQNATDKELKKKREFLLKWGYGCEGSTQNPLPFYSKHKGILSPNYFVSGCQKKADGILFDIEPLYAAATFGLLALDVFTTTGARVNELLQLSNTKDCIRTVKVENKLKFSFYAVPKGRDEVEPFYISDQTTKLIQTLAKYLKEHYKGDKIPSVPYRDERKHLFPSPKPYFFQYNHKAFTKSGIHSVLRFLLHGLRFETREGTPVTVKTHLLRHAFATEAVQRQKMPIDIVAKILHQRDVEVTGYYSEPTPSQIAQSVSDLHDVISDYVDIDEAVLRTPQELEKDLDEYNEKVGVFNNVVGGTCVTDHVCPVKMACLGCIAKIPQPEKKHELLEVIELSKDMEKRYSLLDLDLEVKKARIMRKHARNELKEIEQIEKYREEQKYEPHIEFKK
ncbi:integrase [Bacillus cereus]|nr:integrase [Bacillus cereus]PET03925.1 integrase [Bacillus cereus]PFF33706.1 integrase [Bacillus cereus]PFI44366.1 integrase [Bacillus cereus]